MCLMSMCLLPMCVLSMFLLSILCQHLQALSLNTHSHVSSRDVIRHVYSVLWLSKLTLMTNTLMLHPYHKNRTYTFGTNYFHLLLYCNVCYSKHLYNHSLDSFLINPFIDILWRHGEFVGNQIRLLFYLIYNCTPRYSPTTRI